MINTILFLLVISVSFVSACDPVNASFALCAADLECNSGMYIDENAGDLSVFTFLHLQLDVQGHEVLCWLNCTDEYKTLWVRYLASLKFCGDVQKYYDGTLGRCICRLDHDCHFSQPKSHSPFPEALSACIIIGVMLGGVVYFVRKRAAQVESFVAKF